MNRPPIGNLVCELHLLKWPTVNVLSWVLVSFGSILSLVANLDYTRSLAESWYFGGTLDGFGRLNSGYNIGNEDPSFDDTVWFLDEYGYLDRIDGDKTDIESINRAFNKVFVGYENGDTEDVIRDLDRTSDHVFRFVNKELDTALNWLVRAGLAIVLLGIVCKALYYGRSFVEMLAASIPC